MPVRSRGDIEGVRLRDVNLESFADSFANADDSASNCPVLIIAEATGESHRLIIGYAVNFSGCRADRS